MALISMLGNPDFMTAMADPEAAKAYQPGGLLSRFDQVVGDNNSALLGLGLGLLGGQGTADGWNQAMRGYLQGEQQDSVRRQLQQKHNEQLQKKAAAQAIAQKMGVDPTLAQADPDTVLGLYSAVQQKRLTPKELSFEERQFNALTPEQQAQYRQQKFLNGGSDGYGLNPIYGTDAQGNPVIMQMGKGGRAVQTALPDGVKLSKEPIKLDAGTHFVLIDPISRQPVGQIPKDLAGAEREKAVGKGEGEAQVAAPAAVQSGQNALATIQKLRTHPGRKLATGGSAVVPQIPGTVQSDFIEMNKQAQGVAFLEAYKSLKGGGAISETEGAKAEQAIARLSRAQSEEGYLSALKDLEDVIQAGVERARKQGGATTQQPQRRRYNPQTGEFE